MDSRPAIGFQEPRLHCKCLVVCILALDRVLANQHPYVQHDESQVVNTSWAVLALISARYPDAEKIRNGLQVGDPTVCLGRKAAFLAIAITDANDLHSCSWIAKNRTGNGSRRTLKGYSIVHGKYAKRENLGIRY